MNEMSDDGNNQSKLDQNNSATRKSWSVKNCLLGLMIGLSAQEAIAGGNGVNTGRENLALSQTVYTPRDELMPGVPMPPQRPKQPEASEKWKNLPWLQLFDGRPYGAFVEIKPYVKPRARPVDLKQLREIAVQYEEDMTDEALLAREQHYQEEDEREATKEALTIPLSKVWMLILSADNNRSHLVEFSKKTKTLEGCLLKGPSGGNLWTYANLVKFCGGELHITKKVAEYLDQCFPPYEKTIATHYFLYDKGQKAVCLHELPTEMPKTEARDRPTANEEVETIASIGGAPYWPLSEGGFFGINCMNVPRSIAAYNRENYLNSLSNSQYTELTSPLRLWAYTYLVRHDKPISCSPARYFVDFVNQVSAFLPDRTVLLVGQGTVLRVRLDDGSTDAPANQVRSIPPKQFIERVKLDGGAVCFEGGGESCHWIDVESLKADKSDSEIVYSKYWLEGFDRAVSHIYFSK
jgi:hypothetical protein